MDSDWVARLRAAMCSTVGVSSPAILYMLGIINNSPWLAVKLVVIEPDNNAPWSVPAAPPSDCISMMRGTSPKMLGSPAAAHCSEYSPIGEDGVIG